MEREGPMYPAIQRPIGRNQERARALPRCQQPPGRLYGAVHTIDNWLKARNKEHKPSSPLTVKTEIQPMTTTRTTLTPATTVTVTSPVLPANTAL